MNEIKLNLENLSENEKELLMSLVKKANTPTSKTWKPKEGDTVFVAGASGEICERTLKSFTSYLEHIYEQGNMFATLEEAKFEQERRAVLKRWRDLSIESGEAENKWNGENLHWYCYCDPTENKIIDFEGLYCFKGESTFFPTIEAIKNAVKEIGEENVKKYILGVKW